MAEQSGQVDDTEAKLKSIRDKQDHQDHDAYGRHQELERRVDKVLHHVAAMRHTVKIIGWTVGILVVVGIFIGWWL